MGGRVGRGMGSLEREGSQANPSLGGRWDWREGFGLLRTVYPQNTPNQYRLFPWRAWRIPSIFGKI